jgi:ribosomal protein S21
MIVVRIINNDLVRGLKKLRRQVDQSGRKGEMHMKEAYEKPSERRRRKARVAAQQDVEADGLNGRKFESQKHLAQTVPDASSQDRRKPRSWRLIAAVQARRTRASTATAPVG